MADRASLGYMRAVARESIAQSQAKLSEFFGVAIPEVEVVKVYDDEHKSAFELQRIAKQLEGLVDAIIARANSRIKEPSDSTPSLNVKSPAKQSRVR